MASKRHLRRKACQNKRAYLTHGEARQMAWNRERQLANRGLYQNGLFGTSHLAPYRCGLCGQWHVGHERTAKGVPGR